MEQFDRREFMRRGALLVGAVAGSTLVASCISVKDPEPSPPAPGEIDDNRERVLAKIDELPKHVKVEDLNFNGQGNLVNAKATILPEKIRPLSAKVIEKASLAAVIFTQYENDSAVNVGKGSGFFMRNARGEIQLISAGHVVERDEPSTLYMFDKDGTQYSAIAPVQFAYVHGKEDLGIAVMPEMEDFEPWALPARNLDEDPLGFAEVVWAINYQGPRTPPGKPAMYPLVNYSAPGKEPYISAIGGIYPGQGEDEVIPGASGGMVIDTKGRVVGITVDNPPLECKSPLVRAEGFLGEPGAAADVYIKNLGKMCAQGEVPSGADIRVVNENGTFAFTQRASGWQ